jgi:hypothetical protein
MPLTIAQQSLYDWAQQSPLSGNPRALVWELAQEAQRTGRLEFDWTDEEVAARLRVNKKTVEGIVSKLNGFIEFEREKGSFHTLFRIPAPSMVEKVSAEMSGEKVSPASLSLRDFSSPQISQIRREEEREPAPREKVSTTTKSAPSLSKPRPIPLPEEPADLATPEALGLAKQMNIKESTARWELEKLYHDLRGKEKTTYTLQRVRTWFMRFCDYQRARGPTLAFSGQPEIAIDRRNNGNQYLSGPRGRQERTSQAGVDAVEDVVAGYSSFVGHRAHAGEAAVLHRGLAAVSTHPGMGSTDPPGTKVEME